MSDTERALIEAMSPIEHFTAGDGQLAARVREGAELLTALRAALPEGVVLTRDGLAKVTEVGGVEWCDDHQGIVDECSSHEGCDLADGEDCRPAALYTLIRAEETLPLRPSPRTHPPLRALDSLRPDPREGEDADAG